MSYDKNKQDCPRGFHWCKEKKECVPQGTGVEDRLELKYERYFFKGEGPMENKKVNEASDLVDLAFDESFEIFGKSVKARKKVDKILDAVKEAGTLGRVARGVGKFAKGVGKDVGVGIAVGGALAAGAGAAKRMSAKNVCSKYEKGSNQYKACMHKLVHGTREGKRFPEDVDLGKGTISTTGRPYDHPIKMRVKTDVKECGMMGGGPLNKGIGDDDIEVDSNNYGFDDSKYDGGPEKADNPRKHQNRINQVPNQNAKALYQSIRQQMVEIDMMHENKKEEYQKYFNGMLKKFGVSSPKELDNEKKKEFFSAVDAGWKGIKEGWIGQILR